MSKVTFQGKPLNTLGDFPVVDSTAMDFSLVSGKLKNVSLATYAGKTKILCIVPSLDTPTCAASARIFNQKASGLDDTVVLVISADLPFAQSRFCETEGIKNVIPLSSFRSNFAEEYGVYIKDTVLAGLMARAVIVIDENNKIIYTELVSEIADEPNYDAVMDLIKEL